VSASTVGRYAWPSILLVEDDHGDAVLVQACLADAGVGEELVTWTRTFADAIAALADEPGCILLDLGLPDAAGLPAVRALVTAAGNTPVIVLTGRLERDGAEALAAGAQDYLVKDTLSGEGLQRSIRYAVERTRADQSRRVLRSSVAERARLERGLLPVPLLASGNIVCSTYYRPGSDGAVLGGDFFDVIETPDGTLRAIVGDVMGHGPDEAALGVHLRVAWRTLRISGADDATVLPLMARLLDAEQGSHRKFATVCEIAIRDGAMTVRVAGHPAPIVVAAGGTSYLDVRTAPPLGVAPLEEWPASTAELPPNASVLLYTDGLLDAYAPEPPTASIGVEELVHAMDASRTEGTPLDRWLPGLLSRAPRRVSDDVAAVMLTIRTR